jgi:hypothetical protein
MAEASTTGAQQLYITLSPDGQLKVGTCNHCVVQERGRPERAWNPDGDKELDFPRDQLIAQLARLGVSIKIVEQYVCP